MKIRRDQLKKIIKEELEISLRETSNFDAPEFSNTNIKKDMNSKESILISALMDYFDIESTSALGLVEPIKKLVSKLSIDEIMNKIIALSQKDPLDKIGSIATKNLFLTYLRDIHFDFRSPTSLLDVESEYNKWMPKKSVK